MPPMRHDDDDDESAPRLAQYDGSDAGSLEGRTRATATAAATAPAPATATATATATTLQACIPPSILFDHLLG